MVTDKYGNILRRDYRVKEDLGKKIGTVVAVGHYAEYKNTLVKWDDENDDEWVPAEQLIQTDRVTDGRRRRH